MVVDKLLSLTCQLMHPLNASLEYGFDSKFYSIVNKSCICDMVNNLTYLFHFILQTFVYENVKFLRFHCLNLIMTCKKYEGDYGIQIVTDTRARRFFPIADLSQNYCYEKIFSLMMCSRYVIRVALS